METYYQLLDLPQQATPEQIAAAYQQRREGYSLERIAQLDTEFRSIAEQRLAELERAFAVLSDPEQRREYDASLQQGRAPERTGVSQRELLMAAGGLVVGLLVIAAVWAFTAAGPAAGTAGQGLPAVGETNRPAPEFALPGLDGGTVQLSDYRGKVVLVNFWGTWCEPCKEEMPALQAAYQELNAEGFEIIGINLYSQEPSGDGAVREFLKPYGITYPVALDTDGAIARAFQISPIPVSYFIDPSGSIRYVRIGTLQSEEVRALFARLRQNATALR